MSNKAWPRLAWLLLKREWFRGQLRLMALSLSLAVATVVSIALLVAQLQGAVNQRSSTFIAADRVLSSAKPVPEAWLEQARFQGLEQAQLLEFTSMAFAGDNMLLASIKAVDDNYPLRGQLKVAQVPFGESEVADTIPPQGEVWVAPRLLGMLGTQVGQVLEIGNATFTISRIVAEEPDAPFNLFAAAPRVLLNLADVPATGVVQPGSRLSWRYLFAGEDSELTRFGAWLKDKRGPGQRYYGIEQSRSPIASALERTRSYLLLACLLAVGLACTAVAIAANRYCESQADGVAVLKTLGADSRLISRIYLALLTMLSLMAIIVGCGLGWLLEQGLLIALADLLPPELPAAGWQPLALGAVTGAVCAFFFTVYPLLRLLRVPALKVLRHELLPMGRLGWLNFAAGGTAIFSLMWLYSGNLLLSVLLFGGAMLLAGLLWLAGQGMILLVRRLAPIAGRYRLALAALERRRRANSLVLLAFSLAIMLTLLLTLLRGDLVRDWQLQLPPDSPNHFLVNVAPDEVEPIQALLAKGNYPATDLYPVIRGRLVEINGVPVRSRVSKDEAPPRAERSDESTRRELNLTWRDTLPANNPVVAGQWWQPGQAQDDEVSIEQGVAERLGVGLGDMLTFQIGSQQLTSRITSVRTVDWDTMQPNFYMIFPPGVLDNYPATWIGSFFLPSSDKPFLTQLLKQFPTVTVLEVDRIIAQILQVIEQVSRALELVLGTVMVAGALVLVACVQISLTSREQELALLRTLGARNRLLWQNFALEFLLLGALAGLLAAVATETLVRLLQSRVFEMTPNWHPWLWGWGPVAGALLITGLALLTLRHLLGMSALTLIRRQS